MYEIILSIKIQTCTIYTVLLGQKQDVQVSGLKPKQTRTNKLSEFNCFPFIKLPNCKKNGSQ